MPYDSISVARLYLMFAMKKNEVIISLGSNTRPRENMGKAMNALREMLPGIVFTDTLKTEPIGIESDAFLNCMAKGTTEETLDSLNRQFKEVERNLGDNGHSTNIVNIDIDILAFGDQLLRPSDWERPYIKALYELLTTL